MSTGKLTVSPLLFNDFRGTVQVTVLREAELSAGIITTFLSSATSNVLGATASYGHKGVLSALILSTETRCLRILFSAPGTKNKGGHKKSRVATDGRRLLQNHILCNRAYHKLAFDAERVSCGLYFDHELRIAGLVDAESLSIAKTRGSVDRLMAVLGGEHKVHKRLALKVFDKRLRDIQDQEFAVLRAWATSMAGASQSSATRMSTIPPIHTDSLDDMVLTALAKCVRDADQLTALKPTKVKNDVNTQFSTKDGQLNVTLQRYTTRIRRNDRQHIVVESSIKGRKPVRSKGTVGRVIGKNASLNLAMSTKDAALATIKQVYTYGPENATNAELARTMAILSTLQQSKTFLTHPLARRIFLGEGPLTGNALPELTPVINYSGPLNGAQKKAVEHILSGQSEKAITVVQGPPGTGKTTVVAASVTSMAAIPSFINSHGIWLVAHSNVAVKKMAEKLVDVGFRDFKLLVSFEFHFDWHEHLYGDVLEANVIRGDQFPDSIKDTETRLAGSKVILCSLSMFSSSRMVACGFTKLVPISVVLIDEASQIDIGDYIPLLNIHGHHVKKMVFIGDDKQLAPFGQDDLGTLRSIFELANVRKRAIFLDTQYRMPVPVGAFISRSMYGGRLKSQHSIQASSSCRFVDIAHGKEIKAGHSFRNVEEANYVVRIAKRFLAQGKAYRIITPYDGQRSYIENLLKSEGIPWEDRCFNVDSFQGNEADHVIISVVRTEKIGFLNNRRRSNVMLSRCKRSMTICTNRAFVNGEALTTLLGDMCAEWGSGAWLSTRDILAGRF